MLVEIAAADRLAPGSGTVDLDRFALTIASRFGLSKDGKLDRSHHPPLLQAAVLAQEFADMIVLTQPFPSMQRVLFSILAPLDRFPGYRVLNP